MNWNIEEITQTHEEGGKQWEKGKCLRNLEIRMRIFKIKQ